MSTETKLPTQNDVAKLAGIGRRATVSEVLNGTYKGSKVTAGKIRKAAEELGYTIKKDKVLPKARRPVQDEDLPRGVKLYEPKEPQTKTHKWTMEFKTKRPCEWEYKTDTKGAIDPASEKVISHEWVNHTLCLPERPTLDEIKRHMEAAKRKAIK